MKHILRRVTPTALILSTGLVILAGVVFGAQYVRAAWREPSAQPPLGNIYTPLNVGPDSQAKQGGLLLNPYYNPDDSEPQLNYPLEVGGPRNLYVTYSTVTGDLTADNETLYVNSADNTVCLGGCLDTEYGKLEIGSGTTYAGSSGDPINDTALTTTSSTTYGAYGLSLGADQASVSGFSEDGAGVYGVNDIGSGVYAESISSAAVAATSSADYSSVAPYVAGIFAQGRGLGAWAGYFQQRIFASGQVVARQFMPNRLQQSQVPYTAGWEVQDIVDSRRVGIVYIAFDGKNIWGATWGWDNYVYVINPATVTLVNEFPVNFGVAGFHNIAKLEYGGGYIWVAYQQYDLGTGHGMAYVAKINPTTYEMWNYPMDTTEPSQALDVVYDDKTPGGPYVWSINNVTTDTDPYAYSISRIKPDGTGLITFRIDDTATGSIDHNKCINYNWYNCSSSDTDKLSGDRLDNDGNGYIDNGVCLLEGAGYTSEADCEDNSYPAGSWSPPGLDGVCSDRSCTTEADCTGVCNAIWAPATCTIARCTDQVTCEGTYQCDATWTDAHCSDPTYTTEPDCIAAGEAWSDAECSDSNCTDQVSCEGTQCGGTWYDPDPVCRNLDGASFVGENHNTDERLLMDYITRPSGITVDGTNVWVAFKGLISSYNQSINNFAGLGYAKADAVDPEDISKQAVYCTPPASDPGDITYDESTNHVWMTEYPSERAWQLTPSSLVPDLVSINPTTGLIDGGYNEGTGSELQYYPNTPGGPSLWILGSQLYKYGVDGALQQAYTRYGSALDFAFDVRDPNTPYVWVPGGSGGSITRYTVAPPYESSTFIILGSDNQDIVFDGTYIWTANKNTNTVSKFRATDGKKVGDYQTGGNPQRLFYDGTYIWTVNNNSTLTQIQASDGTVIGSYDRGWSGRELPGESDILFDGRYLWISYPRDDYVYRMDLRSCAAGTCSTTNKYTVTGVPALLAYDGTNIWVSYSFAYSGTSTSDKIGKIDPATGAVLGTYTVLDEQHRGNIVDMLYDGTYLWLALQYVDYDGNSLYKVDTSSCSGGTCTVAGKYPLRIHPGHCTDAAGQYCTADAQCSGSAICVNDRRIDHQYLYSYITSLGFDGTYIWTSTHGATDYDIYRECRDGKDNDGDGKCDRYGCSGMPADPDCADYYTDLHEESSSTYFGTSTDIECIDGIDNDGNGYCDYDGAAGNPGCNGKPDPGCSGPTDASESVGNNMMMDRVNATTGALVESFETDEYCGIADFEFDGSHMWATTTSGCSKGYILRQYFAGTGWGLTNMEDSVLLQGVRPEKGGTYDPGKPQSGSISISGSASLENELNILDDLVAPNNAWGGVLDTIKSFAAGCDDGEFAKGIDRTNNQILCRPL